MNPQWVKSDLDKNLVRSEYLKNLQLDYDSLEFQNNFFLQVFADSKKIKNLQNFLIKNKLSSNMWVILVKN
jgi:hypothetical protein